jgi:uncharacterized protein (UPF0276 family)
LEQSPQITGISAGSSGSGRQRTPGVQALLVVARFSAAARSGRFLAACLAFALASRVMAVFGHDRASNEHSGTALAILTLIAEAFSGLRDRGKAVASRPWEASEPAGIRGTGIGWRAEIDLSIARLPGVDFVEVVAENVTPGQLPATLLALRERGLPAVPHGVSLSLGGAGRPDSARLAHLAALAQALGSPLVSEHVAFCRAGGLAAGHLLPVPRTRAALDILTENVRIARDALPVPLALENIAALISWPEDELTEGEFLTELAGRTGAMLLLDLANLYTAQVNFGHDAVAALRAYPLERVAYVHVAGGVLRDGLWHDTHAHPVPGPVLDLLAALAELVPGALPGVLLERDDAYPPDAELAAELAAIRAACRGQRAPPAAPLPAAPSKGGLP